MQKNLREMIAASSREDKLWFDGAVFGAVAVMCLGAVLGGSWFFAILTGGAAVLLWKGGKKMRKG